jgi:tRNA pseudouridine(55) synthase
MLQFNKITKDNFNRIWGILVLDKSAGITSHDLVDKVRKRLNTRKVGHAGALDPFATGIMIILVGKATKLSQKFSNLDKEYKFDVLFGISTDTQDTEGQITNTKKQISTKYQISKSKLKEVLDSFKKDYYQQMPIYSSVKVGGVRLRELARASKNIETFQKNGKKFAKFELDIDSKIYKKLKKKKNLTKTEFEVEIPKRKTDIKEIRLLNLSKIKGKELEFQNDKVSTKKIFQIAKIRASVSKGTYIRQLAEDIGERLGDIPAMLYTLRRVRIGDTDEKQIVSLNTVGS